MTENPSNNVSLSVVVECFPSIKNIIFSLSVGKDEVISLFSTSSWTCSVTGSLDKEVTLGLLVLFVGGINFSFPCVDSWGTS